MIDSEYKKKKFKKYGRKKSKIFNSRDRDSSYKMLNKKKSTFYNINSNIDDNNVDNNDGGCNNGGLIVDKISEIISVVINNAITDKLKNIDKFLLINMPENNNDQRLIVEKNRKKGRK